MRRQATSVRGAESKQEEEAWEGVGLPGGGPMRCVMSGMCRCSPQLRKDPTLRVSPALHTL